MVECLFRNYVIVGSCPVVVTELPDIAPVLNKEFLDIQANIEYGFSLKGIQDITRTYSQMDRRGKYSQFSSLIWSLQPNG